MNVFVQYIYCYSIPIPVKVLLYMVTLYLYYDCFVYGRLSTFTMTKIIPIRLCFVGDNPIQEPCSVRRQSERDGGMDHGP